MTAEQDLIRRVQSGEREAFREIVELHKQTIYYLALDLAGSHDEAEDLSQEVFIKAFRYLKNFRGESKLSSWLYRITLNCYLDQRRKRPAFILSMDKETTENGQAARRSSPQDSSHSPEQGLRDSEVQRHLQRALNKLSPRQRSVFVLRHYQNLPLKEIGEVLEIAEGTVKSLLSRALKRLQKELTFYQSDMEL